MASQVASGRPNAAARPADGYWIVSSRDVRGTPAVNDCVRELEFLYCTSQGRATATADQFFGSLNPNRPVCIVTHGSYNYWKDVLTESERCDDWIRRASEGRDVQFVYFTWPSSGYAHVVFPVELRILGRRAAVHGGYLAQLVSQFPDNQPVTIMGHSHGARCTVAALHALGGGSLDDGSHLAGGAVPPRRIRAVLIAAAIDHDWLNPGNRYERAIVPTEAMLTVHNPRDGWLSVYPLHTPLKGRQPLGSKGFQADDLERLGGYSQRIQQYDASPIAGKSHDFVAFNTSAEIADVVGPYVTFAQRQQVPPMQSSRQSPGRGNAN